METATIMIIHYTNGWTQHCVRSFRNWLPNERLIVFNNNPYPGQRVRKTRGFWGQDSWRNHECQSELAWLRKQDVQIVEVPRSQEREIHCLPFHGDVLDFAFRWCLGEGIERVLHIEPDCQICGTNWRTKMLAALEKWWIVGTEYCNRRGDYVTHLCPTAWRVEEVLELGVSFNKQGPNINTAQAVMKSCREIGRAGFVNVIDFLHLDSGSARMFPSLYK